MLALVFLLKWVLLDVDCRFGKEDGISKRYAAFNEGREDKKKKKINLVRDEAESLFRVRDL